MTRVERMVSRRSRKERSRGFTRRKVSVLRSRNDRVRSTMRATRVGGPVSPGDGGGPDGKGPCGAHESASGSRNRSHEEAALAWPSDGPSDRDARSLRSLRRQSAIVGFLLLVLRLIVVGAVLASLALVSYLLWSTRKT